MFTRAKKILASELMYALDKDEDEAEQHLDDLLAMEVPVQKQPVVQPHAHRLGAECHAADRRHLVVLGRASHEDPLAAWGQRPRMSPERPGPYCECEGRI